MGRAANPFLDPQQAAMVSAAGRCYGPSHAAGTLRRLTRAKVGLRLTPGCHHSRSMASKAAAKILNSETRRGLGCGGVTATGLVPHNIPGLIDTGSSAHEFGITTFDDTM